MPKDKEAAKSKSAAKAKPAPPANVVPAHGAADLPSVHVDSYNLELQDQEGFIGDRASNRAFRAILDEWRQRLDEVDKDPLPDTPTDELSKKKIDKLLDSDDVESRGLIHSVIEDFAQELAGVIKRFVRSKGWQEVERIVVGGGLRQSKTGELAIGRATLLLKGNGLPVTLVPIRHHPDEAGLIGAAHLAPSWIFAGHDAMLAADIGGTNMRAGIVSLNLKRNTDLSAAEVWKYELWRYRDDKPSREEAVDHLANMINDLTKAANKKVKLAPFLGIGCPGLIDPDGSIKRGGQNLPGNWESERFNLPQKLIEKLKPIDGHPPSIVIHNDAVVQGLSEVPFMQDIKRWGVITIGTGLGNAVFTNNTKPKKS
jgi:predicted NBD/HSP70 family sugar kinase